MNLKKKNKLDLMYTNLLNWRSIIFGFYFVLLGLIGGYFLTLYRYDLTTFFIYTVLIGYFIWIVFEEFKYKEIRNGLKEIETKIERLK